MNEEPGAGGLDRDRMGRARADPGAPDGGPRSPPEGKSRAGHSHGQLASPFLTSSICPNSNEQNSPAQHSSHSIRHAKLLNASECGSKGCLWSGSCLPGGEAGGGEQMLLWLAVTFPNTGLLTRIQSSLASSGAVGLLTCCGQEVLTHGRPPAGPFPPPVGLHRLGP